MRNMYFAFSPAVQIWARLNIARVGGIFALPLDSAMMEVEWGEDIDQPTAQGTIRLIRQMGNVNNSPLSNTTFFAGAFPIIYPNSEFNLQTAIMIDQQVPSESDWMSVFGGRIDSVNVAGDASSLILGCRDAGAWLMNTWLWPINGRAEYGQSALKFGSLGGTRLDVLMEEILAYMGAGTIFTAPDFPWDTRLLVPDVPDFFITEYPQDFGPILQILQDKALQIGWDCRFRYDASGVSRLTLINVDRGRGADLVLEPSQYTKITALDINDADLRNYVEVFTAGMPRDLVFAYDAASRGAFGLRPMRLTEEKAQNITTIPEGQRLADAALSDLKDPGATHEIEMRYYPGVQLGDVHTYMPNGVHYDTEQTFAVTGYRHHLSVNSHRTTISARGRPAAAFRRWQEGKVQMTFAGAGDPTGSARENSLYFEPDDLAFP